LRFPLLNHIKWIIYVNMYKNREFQFEPITLWEARSDDNEFYYSKGKNFHSHKEWELFYLISGESERIVNFRYICNLFSCQYIK
jgi:hypothetical protein